MNLTYQILSDHLVDGTLTPGTEISIRIDQTLTQDSTGTMAYLQFEAMEVPCVKTELSVAYIDHNMLQSGFENADDHRYLETVTRKHGVYLSQARQRRVPSGASGALRRTRKDAAGLRQPHPHGGRPGHARYRRGRAGRGGGDERRGVFAALPVG